MTENWLPIPGFEGRYEVSDLGRVRSHQGRLLRPGLASHGYYTVALQQQSYTLHQLVLLAFVGPRPDGMVARHLSGVKADSRLANLEWASTTRNLQDIKWHNPPNGTNRKLTPAAASAIKARLLSGDPTDAIGREFGVSGRTVRYIRSQERHADV